MLRKNFPHRRAKRRAEAEQRNALWASLGVDDQLRILGQCGAGNRQTDRVLAIKFAIREAARTKAAQRRVTR